MSNSPSRTSREWSRRKVLRVGAGVGATVVLAGVVGIELVQHGVLPGRLALDTLEGHCDVPATHLSFDPLGPSRSGTFESKARRRSVGYTVAWPPGHRPGSELPLVVALHGFGGTHARAISGMSPAQLVALKVGAGSLPPMGIVTVDGGGGYWHPHPNDDPMSMVMDELIPLCQKWGLGRARSGVAITGVSMGGYGALAMAEAHPGYFAAVSAIAPAVWTSWDQAHGANSGAYSDAAEFARYDVVTHASALTGTPVRVASGNSDPFHDGVVALSKVLPSGSSMVFANGCHTGPFFVSQEPASIEFLGAHLYP